MAYYEYVEMNNMQSEDIEVLENIHLILNEKWDYGEVEETKKMMKMFENPEEILARFMSIKEIDVSNRIVLTFLPLTEKEKRLEMIEDLEKWVAESSEDVWVTMEKTRVLAKFFLKIAVYRFCMVHWPKLICKDKTIDNKRVKTLQKELEHWEFCFWRDDDSWGQARDISETRKYLISKYSIFNFYQDYGNQVCIVRRWIEEAYEACKGKVIYEDAKKLRQKYCGKDVVRKEKKDSGHKRITEIENMRKLLDIMERHLSNNLTPQDISELRENMQNWEKNTEKLSEMIGNLSGL